MSELKSGAVIKLKGGSTATIIKELGRGGQGIVYLVELDGGIKKALKWYITAPDNEFYRNLDENVSKGAPSDAFLWPEYLATKQQGSYGYVMGLRPEGYHEFGQYLLARVQFKNFAALLNAAMKICEGFMKLHLSGFSYQDLNDGNFFIHPETGDVLICDNDNVMPQGSQSGILGKARYMAPEVVTGARSPDKYTDRFSLSVVLFLLFYGNHPFEGSRVLACPCMTEEYEKKFYGSEPIFIYDKERLENRPVRGVHGNVLRRWSALPQILRDTFTREFGKECLANPNKRMLESQWQEIIMKVRDMLIICPKCFDETFVESTNTTKCLNCGKDFSVAGSLKIGARIIPLTPNTKIYLDRDNLPDIEVISTNDPKYPLQLKNVTQAKWIVETPSGKLKSVEAGSSMPVKQGLKVKLTCTTSSEKLDGIII